jgi:transposase
MDLFEDTAFQTDSWFDVINDRIILNREPTEQPIPLIADPTQNASVTFCSTLLVFPTLRQRNIIIQWMILYNMIYNFGVDNIRATLRSGGLGPAENTNQAYATTTMRLLEEDPKRLAMLDGALMPQRMRHAALDDVAKAYITADANLKAGNIKRFRLRYKKADVRSVVIRCDTFSKKHNAFNVTILGKVIRTEPSLNTVRDPTTRRPRDSRLVLTNGNFYLYVPTEKEIKFIPNRKPICALDPGGRTIQTLYDMDGYSKLGNGSYKRITALHNKIVFVNNDEIWSREKSNNIRYFATLKEPNTRQQLELDRLTELYPERVDAIKNPVPKAPKPSKPKKHKSKYTKKLKKGEKPKPKHMSRDKKAKTRAHRDAHKDRWRKTKKMADLTRERGKRSKRNLKKSYANHKRPKPHRMVKGNRKRIRKPRTMQQKIKKINKRVRDRITHIVDDMHWKIILLLVRNYITILIGDMSTQGIVRCGGNLSPSVKRHFMSLRHYTFRLRLIAKAKQYVCNVKVIDEFRTSKTCSRCGEVKDDLKTAKVFKCDHCGYVIDRDYNGATNIMKVFGECFNQTRELVAARNEAKNLPIQISV